MTRPLAAVPDLEQELDGLYALPLEEFTKARNDLAARLKQAHQNEAADLVRALKKPSVVAAAANRLAREEPHQVVGLLAAGERLREAQQRALAGDGKAEEVNEAVAAERDALRALLASRPRAARRAVERDAARPPRPDAARRCRRRRGARAPRARPADGGAEGGRLRAARGRQAGPAPLERRGRARGARARRCPARRGADAEHRGPGCGGGRAAGSARGGAARRGGGAEARRCRARRSRAHRGRSSAPVSTLKSVSPVHLHRRTAETDGAN